MKRESSSAPRLLYLETEDWAFCQHRLPLARAARDAGYRVGLIAPESGRGAEIRAEGFDFFPLEMQRTGLNPLEEARAVARIAAIYRRERPDIVHHVALKSALYGTLAARACRVPAIVNSITGLGYAFTGEGMKRAALRLVISNLLKVALHSRRVRVVFQNPDDRALFLGRGIVDPARCAIVRGSGVDTDRFVPSPEPDGPPVVLLAARLLWDKGIGELVEAARVLRGEGLPLRVVLAGDPDPANPACIPRATLDGWRDEGLVELPGHVKEMPALLRGAHVACLPSYREGLPLFLLEAAASGRPCVAADVPGCREAVRHGENGLLVEVRDGRALADALRTLVADPALRKRMGERGREMALAHFGTRQVTRSILDIYASLAGPLGPRGGG
jgi:glycosyltransferase involved in cell wall biosynthesis